MSKTISVLLADDHSLVREGTREILERHEDLHVVGEAGNGQEAVDLALQLCPDIVIMDIGLPVFNGLEATRRIKQDLPKTAILVLTAYDDDQYVFAMLEAGAAGYLLKNARGSELVQAVREVYAGESVLSPAIAKKVLQRFSRDKKGAAGAKPLDVLSERELDVLRLAGRGFSNKEIGQMLVISSRTVQAHMGNIFSKLQVGSRTEAVLFAIRESWISMDEVNDVKAS
jgi:two-component system, NarL family, response regulator LiaR